MVEHLIRLYYALGLLFRTEKKKDENAYEYKIHHFLLFTDQDSLMFQIQNL